MHIDNLRGQISAPAAFARVVAFDGEWPTDV